MRLNDLVSLVGLMSLAHSALKAGEQAKDIADDFQKIQEAKESVSSRLEDLLPAFAQMNTPKADAKVDLLKHMDNVFTSVLSKSNFTHAALEEFQTDRAHIMMDQYSLMASECQDFEADRALLMQEMQEILNDVRSEFDALQAEFIDDHSQKTDDKSRQVLAMILMLVVLSKVMDEYQRHRPVGDHNLLRPRFVNRDQPGVAPNLVGILRRELAELRQDADLAREWGRQIGIHVADNFQPRLTVEELMNKIESGKLQTYPAANSLARIHGEFDAQDTEFTSMITFDGIGYAENNGQGRGGDPIVVTGSDGIDYLHAREDMPALLTYGNRSLMAHTVNARNDTISFQNDAQELYQRVFDLADHQLQQLKEIYKTASAYDLKCQDSPAPERLEGEQSLKMFVTPEPNQGFTLRVFTSPTEYTDTTKAELSDTNQSLAEKFQARLDGTQQGNASFLIREVVNSLGLYQRD